MVERTSQRIPESQIVRDDAFAVPVVGPKTIAARTRATIARRMSMAIYPASALRAFGTVSFGETLYQACSTRPSPSIKNEERTMPKYFLP